MPQRLLWVEVLGRKSVNLLIGRQSIQQSCPLFCRDTERFLLFWETNISCECYRSRSLVDGVKWVVIQRNFLFELAITSVYEILFQSAENTGVTVQRPMMTVWRVTDLRLTAGGALHQRHCVMASPACLVRVKTPSGIQSDIFFTNLMFFWPCIMNWLYINYQLDALIIIYS